MDDEFEVELHIEEIEKAYAIANSALRRARLTLRSLCEDPTATSALISRAQMRCEALVRRRMALRRMLDELQDESPSLPRSQPACGRPHCLMH